MAKIVCLDGYTLNPGDLSWQSFERLGELTVYDRTPDGEILSRAAAAAYLLTNKTPLRAEVLERLPELRYIGVLATGYDVVDVKRAQQRGIVVTNVPTYGTDSVAQHAVALMLELARHVSLHSQAVHQGKWSSAEDWCFSLAPIMELTGKTLGIVGLGRIGLAVARAGAALEMELIGQDIYWPGRERLAGLAIEQVEIDELFARADVVSLHCPLTQDNHHLVNAGRLARMKEGAFLINTSRGPLVDQQALAHALREGKLAGAGLDVLESEPPSPHNPLLGLSNCIITPHIAWYARESRRRLMEIAAGNLRAFLQGNPVNQVS